MPVMALIACLAFATAAYAGDITFTAKASPDHIRPGDMFRLVVTIEGDGARSVPTPELPALDDFEIVGQSTSQQVRMSGFDVVVKKSVTYQVVASKEGTFEIPAITLKHNGKTYTTKPITIRVDALAPAPKNRKPAQRRQRSLFPGFGGLFDTNPPFTHSGTINEDDLIVTMEVDKDNVVPYEQVTATFTFLRAVDLWERPNLSEPKFEGFWVEDLPFENGEREKYASVRKNGKLYRVTKMQYGLIPISTGELTIDPASLVVSVGPWAEKIRLRTKPLKISVRPFPKTGKPDKFSNIVGKFNITAAVEPSSVKVNESLMFRVTIDGAGYLKPVNAPPKPVVEGFEVYDPKITDNIETVGKVIHSRRTIEYLMIPREPGDKTIGQVKTNAFDPDPGEYVELTTSPVKVKVAPASGAPSVASSNGRKAISRINPGIRYIKPDHDTLDDWSEPIHRKWWMWIALLFPLALVGAGTALAKRKRKLMTDKGYARYVYAAKTARAKLDQAKNISDPGDFYTMIDQAVRGYLADKWNLSAPSINRDVARSRFKETGGETLRDFEELFDAVELARYAPVTPSDMEQHLLKARELIDTMEKT